MALNPGRAAALALAAVLLAAAAEVQAARERVYAPAAHAELDTVDLRSGTAVRRLTGPYHALFADLYWIRTIQYYGGTKRRLDDMVRGVLAPEPPPALAAARDDYPLLYPLLDITTTLDPRFNIASRFGAVYLSEPYPRGANRPDLAIALLEKGLRTRPDRWEYMQDSGFVHYWFRHDLRTAAEWFARASALPGAPWWLR